MKKIFFLVVILTLSLLCRAQERKYSTFYYQRATLFEELPVTSSDIIFLGNMYHKRCRMGGTVQEQTCQNPWNQRRHLYGSI